MHVGSREIIILVIVINDWVLIILKLKLLLIYSYFRWLLFDWIFLKLKRFFTCCLGYFLVLFRLGLFSSWWSWALKLGNHFYILFTILVTKWTLSSIYLLSYCILYLCLDFSFLNIAFTTTFPYPHILRTPALQWLHTLCRLLQLHPWVLFIFFRDFIVFILLDSVLLYDGLFIQDWWLLHYCIFYCYLLVFFWIWLGFWFFLFYLWLHCD